jgi:hypothetical protein
MKHAINIIIFFSLVVLSCATKAQAPDSVVILKSESDTVQDFTKWANKGVIGFFPLHMQPGFNGLLNYGVGIQIVFALPKWVTFRGKAIYNIYEGDRALWRDKVYANADEVQKGSWTEGGIDLNFFDFKNKSAYTVIDSTENFADIEFIQREYRKGVHTDRSITLTQQIYGNYYHSSSFLYRPALRVGMLQYKYVYVDEFATVGNLVTNVTINGIYGGLSFSKIGLGKPFFLTLYADVIYKLSIKVSPDLGDVYKNQSIPNQIGYRAGVNGGSNWLGGLVEFGMAPGLKEMETYLKIGLTLNYNLIPKRKKLPLKEEPIEPEVTQ